MMNIQGKKYVKGYTEISLAALARLEELGVELRYSRSHGGYDSFCLPEGNDGSEFHHNPGCPQSAGSLYLKSEIYKREH